jgi:acylphosphatase
MIQNSKLPARRPSHGLRPGKIQNSPEQEAYVISVHGDVQGVSYRYFAKKEAKKLGLVGWAKNEHDGTVSIFVQGDPENIQHFVDWCKEGSPMATVEDIKVEKAEFAENIREFEVK